MLSMKKTIIKIIKWIPALIIFGIGFNLSSQSSIGKMPAFPYADKVVHLICFAGLAFWVAFGCNLSGKSKKEVILPTIIVSLYGIMDEIHQSFTPGRSSTISDWIADTLGAILGSFAFFFLIKILQNRKNSKNPQEK